MSMDAPDRSSAVTSHQYVDAAGGLDGKGKGDLHSRATSGDRRSIRSAVGSSFSFKAASSTIKANVGPNDRCDVSGRTMLTP